MSPRPRLPGLNFDKRRNTLRRACEEGAFILSPLPVYPRPILLHRACFRCLILPSLQVERPLVLQPSPVVCHAADLLAVVVRYWVLHRRASRIHAELLDAVVELFLFLQRSY